MGLIVRRGRALERGLLVGGAVLLWVGRCVSLWSADPWWGETSGAGWLFRMHRREDEVVDPHSGPVQGSRRRGPTHVGGFGGFDLHLKIVDDPWTEEFQPPQDFSIQTGGESRVERKWPTCYRSLDLGVLTSRDLFLVVPDVGELYTAAAS